MSVAFLDLDRTSLNTLQAKHTKQNLGPSKSDRLDNVFNMSKSVTCQEHKDK